MRLLLTNDDGLDSLFLHEFGRALLAAGHEILIAAPRHEQSWIGAAKSRNRPVRSAPADPGLGCPAWVVDGTPCDCVNIALAHLVGAPVDAVVSGINVGLNATLGFILASGTIAGAWEGAIHGLPAAAVSQDLSEETHESLKAGGKPDAALISTLKVSARRAARLLPELLSATAPRSFVVHNINFPFPCTDSTPVRRTVPAKLMVPGLFTPQADDGTHRLIFKIGEDISPAEPLTDRAALLSGAISHTLLDYTILGR